MPPPRRCQIGLEFKWSVSPASGRPANVIPFFKRNVAWLRCWKPHRRRPRIWRRVLNLSAVPRHGGCQSKCVSTPPLEQFGPRVPGQIDKQLIGGAGAADPPAAASTRRSQNSIFRESAGEGLSRWKRAWLMRRQHFGGSLFVPSGVKCLGRAGRSPAKPLEFRSIYPNVRLSAILISDGSESANIISPSLY